MKSEFHFTLHIMTVVFYCLGDLEITRSLHHVDKDIWVVVIYASGKSNLQVSMAAPRNSLMCATDGGFFLAWSWLTEFTGLTRKNLFSSSWIARMWNIVEFLIVQMMLLTFSINILEWWMFTSRVCRIESHWSSLNTIFFSR